LNPNVARVTRERPDTRPQPAVPFDARIMKFCPGGITEAQPVGALDAPVLPLRFCPGGITDNSPNDTPAGSDISVPTSAARYLKNRYS
jgi:hypothetical protein